MRTKTIATLGPSSSDPAIIRSMVEQGVRIFRLNFSHAEAEEFEPTVHAIRNLEGEIGLPLTIMGDLSGPKIRIGPIDGSPLEIDKGEAIYLGLPEHLGYDAEKTYISLDFPEALRGLEVGMPVTLSDGTPGFKVEAVLKEHELFRLKAVSGGILSSNKGITFPGKSFNLPALTDKDRHDLHGALELGFDSFAMSFVQTEKDIADIKREITKRKKWVPVIAKLERSASLNNLEAILAVADGIMVARGDLGLECSLSALPVIQKKIIQACRREHKPAIVATQMLLSMVRNPLPTRAETTDVANAILDGADCVMLSEETAVGKYPVEAVGMIQEIATHAESYLLDRMQGPNKPSDEKDPGKYLAYSACLIADHAESVALVCHSTTGKTAALLSSRRPAQPIFAMTPDIRVIRALNFFWGVRPRPSDDTIPNHLDRVERFVQESDLFRSGDRIVITSGQPTPGQKERHTNQIKIYYK